METPMKVNDPLRLALLYLGQEPNTRCQGRNWFRGGRHLPGYDLEDDLTRLIKREFDLETGRIYVRRVTRSVVSRVKSTLRSLVATAA
jgi:hypothetical protein